MRTEAVLNHKTRNMVYNYISTHSGVTFGRIKRILDLTDGTLRYHLNYLQRSDKIRSHIDNGQRCYYTREMPRPEPGRSDGYDFGALSRTQQRIVTLVRKNPGISVSEFVSITRFKKRVVQYNLKKLRERMIIRKVGEGRNTGYEHVTRKWLRKELMKLLIAKFLKDEIDEETYLYLKEQLRKEGLDES